MNASVTLDTRNFMAAFNVIQAWSGTLPEEALPRAVAFVVKDAKAMTPYVDIGEIDTELSAVTTPMLSTRGARKGLPLKSGRTDVAVVEGGLATKIVLARLHPYSNYNILTDRKYALSQARFSPGGGVAGFLAKVDKVARRMVRSRHSSTHFFQISWNALLRKLAPLVPASYRAAVMTWAGAGQEDPDLGGAQLQGGKSVAVLTIENRLGMDQQFPTIASIRNAAAHRILPPVLQAAIDKNYHSAIALIHKRGMLAMAPQLAGLGVVVKP